MTALTPEELKFLRAVAERPQPFTGDPVIHAIVRKGLAEMSEGRGVVLTAKGEQLLMVLPPE